jgi:4-amino-4-deoxy-L-arabinose transferase-like glycosyltransferase
MKFASLLFAAVASLFAMPAFAAIELPAAIHNAPVREWLLVGSLALLAVAAALCLMRRGSGPEVADGPDLRWWRNP